MTAYSIKKNRGLPVGVYTLAADATIAETVATNGSSATTVQALYFPEQRHLITTADINDIHESFGPGKVLLTDIGLVATTASAVDFAISSWVAPTVPGTSLNEV